MYILWYIGRLIANNLKCHDGYDRPERETLRYGDLRCRKGALFHTTICEHQITNFILVYFSYDMCFLLDRFHWSQAFIE